MAASDESSTSYRSGIDPILAEHAHLGRGPAPRAGAVVKHLLVTNDYPPKIGGIQSLLWEWWRRLPPESFAVLTSPYAGTAEFDAGEPYRIERTREPVLLPHPFMVRQVNELARDFGADFVVIDPAVPLGLIGPSLRTSLRPGPARRRGDGARAGFPVRSRRSATRCVAPARSSPPVAIRRPKASTLRDASCRSRSSRAGSTRTGSTRCRLDERAAAREHFDLPVDAELIVGICRGSSLARDSTRRSVPSARLRRTRPDLLLVIAGGGRDRDRLRATRDRTRCTGQVPRARPERRPAAAVRVCRHLHDAVPQPVGRTRTGRVRHRVRRSSIVRRAAGRRRLRRRRRGGGRWRDRAS